MATSIWLRSVLIVHGLVAAGVGLLFLLWPTAVSEQYQLAPTGAARLLVQALAVTLLLLGLLLVVAWRLSREYGRLAVALALGNGAAFLMTLAQQLAIWETTAGWLTVGIFLFLSGIYGLAIWGAQPAAAWPASRQPVTLMALVVAGAGIALALAPALLPLSGFAQGRTGFELYAITRFWGAVLFGLGLLIWAAADALRRLVAWGQSLRNSLGIGLLLLLGLGLLAPGLTAVFVYESSGSPLLSLVAAAVAAGGMAVFLTFRLHATLNPVRLTLQQLVDGRLANPQPILPAWPLAPLVQPVNFLAAQASETGTMRGRLQQQIREAAAQEERNRLARDLHDSIKQQIFSMSVSAAAVAARWEQDSQGARAALADVQQSAQAAMVEMNAMLQQLRPAPLETMGLVAALREQCEALGYRTGATVSTSFCELPDDEWLPLGAQTGLFRIAQEALANVARHARADQVHLRLDILAEGAIQLTIEDDGQGFDSSAGAPGMGLRNMRERATALGGQVTIHSRLGEGTTVRAMLPFWPLPQPRPVEENQLLTYAERQLAIGLWVSLAGSFLILILLALNFSFFPSLMVALAAFSLGLWANTPLAAYSLDQLTAQVSATPGAAVPEVGLARLRRKVQDRRTVAFLGLLLVALAGDILLGRSGLAYLALLLFCGLLVLYAAAGSYRTRQALLKLADHQEQPALFQKIRREWRIAWFLTVQLLLAGVAYLVFMVMTSWPHIRFFPPGRPVDWWLQSALILGAIALGWQLAAGRLLRRTI
jgi:signal transduction histidine kinase